MDASLQCDSKYTFLAVYYQMLTSYIYLCIYLFSIYSFLFHMPLVPSDLCDVVQRTSQNSDRMSSTPTPPSSPPEPEWPPAADLRRMLEENPLPTIAPDICADDPVSDDDIATAKSRDILEGLNQALGVKDVDKIAQCFFAEQAYWRDQIALTWHLRTFSKRQVIAASLLETSTLRRVTGDGFAIEGQAHFIPALVRDLEPSLYSVSWHISNREVVKTQQSIGFQFSFRTKNPGAKCSGRAMLLPSEEHDNGLGDVKKRIVWRIWVFSTWIDQLDLQPENEALLHAPGRQLDTAGEIIETDVLIIGGGNAAVSIASRLKAMNAESVMVERNPRAGDNWALRYDCLCFHIPTSCCELPYTTYAAELQSPHLLTRGELAQHVRQYVEMFNLNMVTSAKILHTQYDTRAKRWTATIQTPSGQTTVVSKHLVQATGFGSQKPYMPPMRNIDLYKGISIHSNKYKNGKELIDRGVKSVLVVGSANTAFDIMQDCHAAALQTTMAVRSPTYVFPMSYMSQPQTLGAYDHLGVEAADRLFQTGPTVVDSALVQNVLRGMARAGAEPQRYAKLREAGFPVLDSAHPDALLNSNLLERAGGTLCGCGRDGAVGGGGGWG
ncbi:hypothetical protein PG989_012079 [Apiospora arundinis]